MFSGPGTCLAGGARRLVGVWGGAAGGGGSGKGQGRGRGVVWEGAGAGQGLDCGRPGCRPVLENRVLRQPWGAGAGGTQRP